MDKVGVRYIGDTAYLGVFVDIGDFVTFAKIENGQMYLYGSSERTGLDTDSNGYVVVNGPVDSVQSRIDRAVKVLSAAWMARNWDTDDRIFEARAILKGEA